MKKLILIAMITGIFVGCGKKQRQTVKGPVQHELPQELVVYDMYGNKDEIKLPELTIKNVREMALILNGHNKTSIKSKPINEQDFFDLRTSDLINDTNVNYKTYRLPAFDVPSVYKLNDEKKLNESRNSSLRIHLSLGGQRLDLVKLNDATFLIKAENKIIASTKLNLTRRPLDLNNVELNFEVFDEYILEEALKSYNNLYIVLDDFTGERAETTVQFSELYNKIKKDFSEVIILNKGKITRSFYKEKSVDDFLFDQKISDSDLVKFEKKDESFIISKEMWKDSYKLNILGKEVSINLLQPIVFELSGSKKIRSFAEESRNHSYTVRGICERIRGWDKQCVNEEINCSSKHTIVTNQTIAPMNFLNENIYLSFDRQGVDFGVEFNKVLDSSFKVTEKEMLSLGNGIASFDLAKLEGIKSILALAKMKGIVLGLNLSVDGSPSTRYGYLNDNCPNPSKANVDKSFNYVADFDLDFQYKAFVR